MAKPTLKVTLKSSPKLPMIKVTKSKIIPGAPKQKGARYV